LAEYYLDYWKKLKADKAQQDTKFRKNNNKNRIVNINSTQISLWFSPNTIAKNKTANSL